MRRPRGRSQHPSGLLHAQLPNDRDGSVQRHRAEQRPDIAPLTVVAISGWTSAWGCRPVAPAVAATSCACSATWSKVGGAYPPSPCRNAPSSIRPSKRQQRRGGSKSGQQQQVRTRVSIVDGCRRRVPAAARLWRVWRSGGTGGSVGTGGAGAVSPTATPSMSPTASVEASASTATAVLSATTAVVARRSQGPDAAARLAVERCGDGGGARRRAAGLVVAAPFGPLTRGLSPAVLKEPPSHPHRMRRWLFRFG
jgi:hypothetical protein